MSIKLKYVKNAEEAVVHSLPCKIHADTESDVDSFFNPVQVSDKELTTSFRGYPLSGTKVELPDGYKGFIFNDSKDPKPSSYSCVGQFKNFTYWNWDKPPSKNDPVIAAMDWLTFSGAIHDPIEDEDL